MSIVNAENSDITRYQALKKIGEGSFGIVYLVKDLQTNIKYAGKVSQAMIEEETEESQKARLFYREVNLMSFSNHPSIIKYVGYYPTDFEGDPHPTIITELALNGSLREIIDLESKGFSPKEWDFTKKLINIYGISSGMSFLHKHNVIHRDLKPENILLDEYLQPKISDFGLSKITTFLSETMNFQSQKGTKGTPAYMAPEVMSDEKYSESSDVYAFGLIVYEILTSEKLFKNFNLLSLMRKVQEDGYRPTLSDDIPDSYQDLIERCWSQKAEDRPSFAQIVSDLTSNPEFITELVDENEYYDYVDFIEKYQCTFDSSKRVTHFSDFVKEQGRNKEVKPYLYKNNFSDEETCINTLNNSQNSIISINISNEAEIIKEASTKMVNYDNNIPEESTQNLFKIIEKEPTSLNENDPTSLNENDPTSLNESGPTSLNESDRTSLNENDTTSLNIKSHH